MLSNFFCFRLISGLIALLYCLLSLAAHVLILPILMKGEMMKVLRECSPSGNVWVHLLALSIFFKKKNLWTKKWFLTYFMSHLITIWFFVLILIRKLCLFLTIVFKQDTKGRGNEGALRYLNWGWHIPNKWTTRLKFEFLKFYLIFEARIKSYITKMKKNR